MVRISVVIPSFNEGKYIKNAMSGLERQSFRDFETIVVDKNSTDDTIKIVKRYRNVKIINEIRKGISIARNRGAQEARGEILVFLDADTRPSEKLLESYNKAFKKKIIMATGPIMPLENTDIFIWLGYIFVSVLMTYAGIVINDPAIIGSNFAVRKKEFLRARGFDEKMDTYEDWDLSKRLARHGKAVYILEAVVYTSVRRVKKWGMWGYIAYHVDNMVRYNKGKKTRDDYNPVR